VSLARIACGRLAVPLILVPLLLAPAGAADEAGATNPYLGQKEAIDEGEKLYRARCFGCHFRSGGRGPNIFRTKLTEQQFVATVANGGRSGMPAWANSLSKDDILKLYAFVMSRDRL
jgi:mono/diheme cytochrome c family protein